MRTLDAHARAHRRCCRSTRSTCCSVLTTCRCSPGWVPTTPTCCTEPPSRPRAAGGVLGARRGVHARRAVAAHAAPDAPVRASSGHAWGQAAQPRARAGRCWRRCGRRGPAPRATSTTGLPRKKEHWGWNWSDTKIALEYLFLAGRPGGRPPQQPVRAGLRPARAGAAGRRPRPRRRRRDEEAARELVRRAARSPRRRHRAVPARLLPDGRRADAAGARRLVEAGELVPVAVEGGASARRTCTATPGCRAGSDVRALLSPFDPIVWERDRTEHLFGFLYRIEIYVPEAKRVTATTCCPSCSASGSWPGSTSRPTGQAGALLVKGAYAEPGAPAETAAELAAELRRMARWLGARRRRGRAQGRPRPGAHR